MSYILETLFLLAGILLACQIFTNAIEHLGEKLNLGHEFTGSILAAVGTALPETILPLVAIYLASTGITSNIKNEIAIGAIIGAPFMLTSLAMLLLGLSLLINHKQRQKTLNTNSKFLQIDCAHTTRDLKFFLFTFSLAIIGAFIKNFPSKIFIASGLLIAYVLYIQQTYKASKEGAHDKDYNEVSEELYLHSWSRKILADNLSTIILQVTIGLLGIIYFAHHFVNSVEKISELIGISPLILSLIISPIATELPEKFNSWTWSSQGKDSLAIGNISGAMVFQSAIPCSIGILLTPWSINSVGLICASLTILSSTIILISLKINQRLGITSLLIAGSTYFIYLIGVLSGLIH